MADDTLRALVGLHHELARRSREAIATPEEARRANTELRAMMRGRDNHLPEIEKLAEDQLRRRSGTSSGALTHRETRQMAEKLGFELVHVERPAALGALGHRPRERPHLPAAGLDPRRPRPALDGAAGDRAPPARSRRARPSYAEFLHQRLEINYFAVGVPHAADAVGRVPARRPRPTATSPIEDFRDAFGITHEAAALRFTNLATPYLDMTWHFLRVDDDGAVYKAYENDGLRLPVDVTGSTEGEIVCRRWAARRAFDRTNRTTEFYQYTDTPQGTFFESTQIGTSQADEFSITLGRAVRRLEVVPRPRDDAPRAVALPRRELLQAPARRSRRSTGSSRAWPSAKVHAHIFSPLPSGAFPGVDDREVYEFLETHAASELTAASAPASRSQRTGSASAASAEPASSLSDQPRSGGCGRELPGDHRGARVPEARERCPTTLPVRLVASKRPSPVMIRSADAACRGQPGERRDRACPRFDPRAPRRVEPVPGTAGRARARRRCARAEQPARTSRAPRPACARRRGRRPSAARTPRPRPPARAAEP